MKAIGSLLKEGAEIAVKTGARAATETTAVAAKAVTTTGLRSGIRAAATTVSKTAVPAVAKTGVAKTAASTAVRELAEAAARSTAKAGTETTQSAFQKSLKWAADHPTLVAGAAGAGGIMAVTLKRFAQRNNKALAIKSIARYAQGEGVVIRFEPAEVITSNDAVDIQGTDCLPSLDGRWEVKKQLAPDSVLIDVEPLRGTLTRNGTKGTLVLHTTFESQLANTLKDTTSIAGGAVAGSLGGLFEGLGIDPEEWRPYAWGLCAVCLLLALCLCSAFASVYVL